MINLLPSRYKQELIEEENLKIVLILGIIFLAFLICSILILFSVRTSIRGNFLAQKIIFETSAKELKNGQTEEIEQRLISANRKLNIIDSFYKNQFHSTDLLKKVSDVLPERVYLTSFDFNLSVTSENNSYRGQVALSGFAPTRESLLVLKKNLEEEKIFQEINFPSSNWVKPVNIDFSANFQIQ